VLVDELSVRVLTWADSAKWQQKLAEADEIEGYDAKHPDQGEYTRRLVEVQLESAPAAAGSAPTATATTSAYIYLTPNTKPNKDWVHIPSGHWLKRKLHK
jgi:hypothetical protein